ncbi:MAG: Smr/MutS family protein [Hyphomicrobiales bacterium]|nr:Smr/MutS family protein [Hyphomicrobiales bacterium]
MARKRQDKPPTPHRPIVPDFELWTRLKDTITPLETRRLEYVLEPEPVAPKVKQTAPGRPAPATKPQPAVKPKVPAPLPITPSLTGLDRRTSQRLSRGQIEVDSRIDLHGESVETARFKLRDFLISARARGDRTVLVITGKGSSEFARHTLHGASHFHAPERQGRLRRMATQWFHDAEFSHLISGFQPAHPKHGGGGAFYVRLRRADRGYKS